MKAPKNTCGAMLLLAAMGCFSNAHAATTTITVTTLNAGTGAACVLVSNSANTCNTLTDALTAANALPASVGDNIAIGFATGLSGYINVPVGATKMAPSTPSSAGSANVGVFYHINANRPVTIDFDDRVGVTQDETDGSPYVMVYVQSNDVVIRNVKRDAVNPGGYGTKTGLVSSGASFVIKGERVTIQNAASIDAQIDQDFCIALLDGADAVTIENYSCKAAWATGSMGVGLHVDIEAEVGDVTLTNVTFNSPNTRSDIWVASGTAGNPTVVNSLSISNSDFNSSPLTNPSITIRSNSAVNNLVVNGSRFTGSGVPGIFAEPDTGLGLVSIVDNTATDTGSFFGTDVDVTHTDIVTIRGNTLTGVSNDGIFLQSATSGTVIEDNQFLNLTSTGNVAGIRIATGASGTNNVIRDNVFDQTAPTDRLAIWMRANPGIGVATGWSIENNSVSNIQHNAFGPIFLDGAGNTLVSGNTFGAGTLGAVVGDPAPETDDSFFVVNEDTDANGKIQTWRPTQALTTGSAVIVTVAPVSPALGTNTDPAGPVSIDVYYTAADNAEVYLGRITGTHTGPVTHTFAYSATAGAVRAQVTDSDGKSSQYSAAVALQPTTLLEARARGGAMGSSLLLLLAALGTLRSRTKKRAGR